MMAVPQLWGTSNGTFVTDKVGDIEISFWEYSNNEKVHLQPDIVVFQYCVIGTEFITLGNGICYTN